MSGDTSIAWTDHTFNPWWGCLQISPGCANCYAKAFANRIGQHVWGSKPRRFFGEKHWAEPHAWNAQAVRDGVRRRVFCASMADVFEAKDGDDGARMALARARLWKLIAETSAGLDWLLLTKRPENIDGIAPWRRSVTDHARAAWPANVWIGTTVEDQARAHQRLPWLTRVPARVRFVSYEPALEAVDFRPWLERWRCRMCQTARSRHELTSRHGLLECPRCLMFGGYVDQLERGLGIDWLIIGGESGNGARPFDPEWARSVLRDCRDARVAPFVKQFGARPAERVDATELVRIRLKNSKGEDPSEWPEDLRVREFPSAEERAA